MLPAKWWDERVPGGSAKGWLFLVHPGPSLLVTATFVAVAALAARSAPSPLRVAQLAAAMLCVQFAIGIANDLADVAPDSLSKPYKPLARAVVPRPAAAIATAALCVAGLALAASVNLETLALFAAGLTAGMSYNLGLRRTPLSPVPWWAGIGLLPLAAFAAAAAVTPRLWPVLPLSGLVALGLHLANAAPDLAGDRRVRHRSLPVLLGERASLYVSEATLIALAVFGLVVAGGVHRLGPWVIGGALVLLLAVAVVSVRRERRPFPLLAAATAVFAATWLATVAVR